MGCDSCLGLPTKGNSRLLFMCEKGYVATQLRDTKAGGGGVCCHHSKLISYPHVFFFPQSFLIFFINHLTFFFYFPVL